jgi:hypothetical protein
MAVSLDTILVAARTLMPNSPSANQTARADYVMNVHPTSATDF